MSAISRRTMLLGTAGGILTIGGLAACGTSSGRALAPTSEAVRRGLAVVRTGAGAVPTADAAPVELTRTVLLGSDVRAAPEVQLPRQGVDRTHDLVLGGSMAGYRWTINGKTFDEADPLEVRQGERVRLRLRNMTMMFHPMHVHGHTFGQRDTGVRKDTVIVRPMQSIEVDLDANNPGQWATHCHNSYHAETGMMTTLSYRA